MDTLYQILHHLEQFDPEDDGAAIADYMEAQGFHFHDEWNPGLSFDRGDEEVTYDLTFEQWVAYSPTAPTPIPGLAVVFDPDYDRFFYTLDRTK